MALAATAAKLLASLDLDTKPFEAGTRRAGASLGALETRFGKIGGIAQRGLGQAANNIKRIGVVAGGLVALNIGKGIQSLSDLEDAVFSVDGAIKQMGLTGQVTGAQVATWANEIEDSVQRAFDDKAITQAATTLIRFGKISTANLRPALVVMTDLAAKTGSVESASTLLAKALADPEKAAGKLARAGVVLTKEQQDQIKAMVKAGHTAKAQAFLLAQLETATKGAAAASKGPYRDALNILADVTEDAQRALGEGFLPVISKVADRLSTFLADKGNIEKIRGFGQGLADGFDKLLGLIEKIPFAQIGDSLKIAGAGAKALFDAFTALPPWIQTAVLTGWGLNKLTGGALGGIVGELGKGLIKGVLGMNAGVVNINAAVVNGVGAGAGGTGGPSVLGLGLRLIPVVAVGALVGEAVAAFNRSNGITPRNIREEMFHATVDALNGSTTLQDIATNTSGSPDERNSARLTAHHIAALNDRHARLLANQQPERQERHHDAAAAIKKQDEAKAKLEAAKAAIDRSRDAIETARIAQVSAQRNAADRIVDAIDRIKLDNSVKVFVDSGDAGNRTSYESSTNIGGGGGGRKP